MQDVEAVHAVPPALQVSGTAPLQRFSPAVQPPEHTPEVQALGQVWL